MAGVVHRTMWLVLATVFLSLCVSPARADWCSETVAGLPPGNSDECEVVIKPTSSVSTYYGAYQAFCMSVTAGCLTVSVNENVLVNAKVSENSTNGYLSINVLILNITANMTLIFSVFGDSFTILAEYETSVVVYDMNFSSKLGCTTVDLYWTLVPGFTYSVKVIFGNTTKIYSDLISNSISMELVGDQESCDVFLSGTRLYGGTQTYSQTVPLFQDPAPCVDGQWNEEGVQLICMLTLSCDCPSRKPTVIYIETSKNSSYMTCDVRLLVCDGSLASVSRPSNTEIEMVLHDPLLLSPSVLTVTARVCNSAGCILTSLNKTKDTPTASTGQPGSTTDEVPSLTSDAPNYDDQIFGGIAGGVVLAFVALTILIAICSYCVWCKPKKKDEYSPQEMQTILGEAEPSTRTKTTSEADVIVVGLEHVSIQHSVEVKRQEPKLPAVVRQNSPFGGGAAVGDASNGGNPTCITEPIREDDSHQIVSSKGPMKPSSSVTNIHGVSLTEDELQAKLGVRPSENPSQIANPPQNEPTTTDTRTSTSEASQDSKDVCPPVPA